MTWPANLPRQAIAALRLVETPTGLSPAIYAMLGESEIRERSRQTIYQHFLFAPQPHPAILWATGLFKPGLPPRWLRTFIDLKNPPDRTLLDQLTVSRAYQLLFFALESGYVVSTVTQRIDPRQCELIGVWLKSAASGQTGALSITKNALNAKFEWVKPSILREMESFHASPRRSYQSRALVPGRPILPLEREAIC